MDREHGEGEQPPRGEADRPDIPAGGGGGAAEGLPAADRGHRGDTGPCVRWVVGGGGVVACRVFVVVSFGRVGWAWMFMLWKMFISVIFFLSNFFFSL